MSRRSPDVVELFCELAAVASPSGHERAVADLVEEYLHGLGLDVVEDAAAGADGASAGNLYTRIEAVAAGEPLLLAAHLDTVSPRCIIEPEVRGGVVRNRHDTILGADDKAAVAVMLEATRRIVTENRPHAGIELLFTPSEEVGLLGALAFDHTRLHARIGYVYDQEAPIGTVVVGAPSRTEIQVTIHGRAAHAGMRASDGRSAIVAAARAIADLPLGEVDVDSTANVGVIQGGSGVNVVPDRCSFVTEVRSHDLARLDEIVADVERSVEAAAVAVGCDAELTVTPSYQGYRLARDDRVVLLAAEALASCGYAVEYVLSGGGADANVFNERGLRVANLGNGMTDIHTPQEQVATADLRGMVDVTLALVECAAAQEEER